MAPPGDEENINLFLVEKHFDHICTDASYCIFEVAKE
jgi:hypothetical protein